MALSKTGRFLSKAEILGVGVFSPLPISVHLKQQRKNNLGPEHESARHEKKRRTHESASHGLGVFPRPLTLILLQKYRDTNGRRIVIQIALSAGNSLIDLVRRRLLN